MSINSKRKFINPMTCDTRVFLQHFGNYQKMENKKTEHDVCDYFGKFCYSYREALNVIKTMKSAHSRTRNRVALRIYKCTYCNYFHLTSQMKTVGENKRRGYFAA